MVVRLFRAVGLDEWIAFEKRRTDYRFFVYGRDMLATIVEVSELDDVVFIEVETLTAIEDVGAALDLVRQVLDELGVSAGELTAETYTDAVARRRDR